MATTPVSVIVARNQEEHSFVSNHRFCSSVELHYIMSIQWCSSGRLLWLLVRTLLVWSECREHGTCQMVRRTGETSSMSMDGLIRLSELDAQSAEDTLVQAAPSVTPCWAAALTFGVLSLPMFSKYSAGVYMPWVLQVLLRRRIRRHYSIKVQWAWASLQTHS